MPQMQLSKSDYLLFLKHPAWLWLKKHDKKKLPEPDAALQGLFDEGNLFESLVEQQFVGISRLGFESYQEYLDLPGKTIELLDKGDKIISQGRFEFEQLTCICDVIELVGERELELWEIKASTSVKPEHIDDLAFQTTVLEGAGFKVKKAGVLFCNRYYVRHGKVDPHKIAVREDVTEKVQAKLSSTRQQIEQAVEVMNSSQMPDPSPARARGGGFREWLDIYLGLYPNSEKYHAYSICRPNAQLFAELESRGITKLIDIPPEVKLKPAQRRQVEATQADGPIIDADKIKWFLDKFSYPLYFLDYETLGSVVPPFDGLRPYQQLPFQYSLHVIDSPGAQPRHMEYLHTDNSDPTRPLLRQLQQDIGTSGTVLVWSESFEKSCNQLMAKLQPKFGLLMAEVNDRIVDLMLPFWNGWYLHADFCGSASIKKVLPVLVPELNHKDLEISEGATAQRLWMQTVLGGVSEGKNKLMADLREYCELDTFAMVKIYQHLLDLEPTSTQPEQLSLL